MQLTWQNGYPQPKPLLPPRNQALSCRIFNAAAVMVDWFRGQGLGKIVTDATDEAAAGNIRATERGEISRAPIFDIHTVRDFARV